MAENTILERIAVHSGQIFIRSGESNTDSYIIQDGEVQAFITENGHKIVIDHFKAGSIIAEKNLLFDSTETLSYEALTDSTVIKVTRQDFEKKIHKLDSTLSNVISHLVNKLRFYEERWTENTLQARKNDLKAMEIVDYLLRDMSDERKLKYEEILLPHFNIMVKALDELKQEERKAKQDKDLQDSITRAKSDEKQD